ncbi:MAG TPA: proline racemase family protein [Thermoanaerobaculia bacterium]|nr:proline racemase family protein [Thermoanaerobaculia bacterium]
MQRIRVIDSHTEGEPTRVVIDGGPDLGSGSLADRCDRFRNEFDRFRSAIVNEPRGSDVYVGALLVPPVDRDAATGVIFFNNVGYLGMCGHGTIGVVTTLAHLGRIRTGAHRIETPVGTVTAELHDDGSVSVTNVPSYRLAKSVSVDGITGDIAWGGNWFFLVSEPRNDLDLANAGRLTELTWSIRQALERQGIGGANGAVIDHVELFGPPKRADADSRNFVLCPGKAYDRSPCGTGTSAKLACLFADGKLRAGQVWRQESIVGSLFEGSVEPLEGGAVRPTIRGFAYVNAESTLVVNDRDPFAWGIRDTPRDGPLNE